MSRDDVCFVIMPYDVKKDIDGREIDFDEIYEYVIYPAVESVDGLRCLRCDDIERPGWIHERMLSHIFEARVALIDISTLNPNVFYELGVRHALRESITVLIRRKGTRSPFNIEGMNTIEYDSTGPRGIEEAKKAIRDAVVDALNAPGNIDSLVYNALPGLEVRRGPGRRPRRLMQVQVFEYPLTRNPAKRLALITGDREYIGVGDIWVNSENTNMQMDRFFGASTSATIRYLGARKNLAGNVVEDVVAEDLQRVMDEAGALEVAPETVIATTAGALEQNNNVKRIFHVATVKGEPREGYRPVASIERCVKNALREAGKSEHRDAGLSSILLPILGTGPAGGDLREHAERCFGAAIEYLESHPQNPIETVYFYIWSDMDLEVCQALVRQDPRLQETARVG